jgi:hypothetical protein
MTAKTIPRHARPSGRQRWVPPPRAGRLHRVRAPGMARPGPGEGPMPVNPLAGPVAITERAVWGDQIRRPIAWCEMAACSSRYEDLAALGEADIRARALAAGWRYDHAGRLLCPYCLWRCPRLQAASVVAGQDNAPAFQQTGHVQAGRISAVQAALSAWHWQLPGGQDLRPRWVRLLAALVCGRNGWTTPPLGPAVGAPGCLPRAGSPGPSDSQRRRAAATPPANGGGDDCRRQVGQPGQAGHPSHARSVRAERRTSRILATTSPPSSWAGAEETSAGPALCA